MLKAVHSVHPQSSVGRQELKLAFGSRLKLLRERRGLSQAQFGQRYGVDGLASLERGGRDPRLSHILAICDGMKVTPNVLLAGLYSKPAARHQGRPTSPKAQAV